MAAPKSLIRRRNSQRERKGFSGMLTRARLSLEMPQREMARALGIPLASYQKYELGLRSPLISDIQKCCEYFGWDLDEVMALEGAAPSTPPAVAPVAAPVTQVLQFPVGPVQINLQVTVSWL